MMLLLSMLPLAYGVFLLWCRQQWKRTTINSHPGNRLFPDCVSVIVPVRDEQDGILKTLLALENQESPGIHVEIVVVDDHSADETPIRVREFCQTHDRFRLIRLHEEEGKKAALTRGVREAKGDWVFTVDGDATMGTRWLVTMLKGRSSSNISMLCGPAVSSLSARTPWQRLARWESVGLTVIAASGIRAGRPFFCNGANLGFKREEFIRLGGYDGASSSLSGDDTTLLLKFKPEQVAYVSQRSAVVHVPGADKTNRFLSQRQRWASKIPKSLSRVTLAVAFVAWAAHAALLTLILMAGLGYVSVWFPLLAGLFMALMESVVLKAGKRLVNDRVNVALLLVAQPFYALAILIIGVMAVAAPFTWKGRKSR